jgi:hemolysin III
VLAAIVLKLAWSGQPKRVSAAIGIALGWVGAAAFSQLLKLPVSGLLLVVAGGIAYTLGALTYALRRPDPIPAVFGYHEVFHLLTLLGVGCQYGAIAFYVLPRA